MVRVLVAIMVWCGTAWAQLPMPPLDPELEKKFRADIETVSAEAARAFDEGNKARQAQRVDETVAGYRKAAELAPKVDHPHRRLCSTLATIGEVDAAVKECELALSLVPTSPYNKSALGSALLMRDGPGDLSRGLDLTREAAEAKPDEAALVNAWCGANLQAGNQLGLTKCSEQLLRLDPDGVAANFFGSVAAAGNHDYEEAHRLLRKAKDAGLPQEAYDMMARELDKAEKDEELLPFTTEEMLGVGSVTFGVWLVALLVLLGVGRILSAKTQRTVDDAATDATGSERERKLRRTYKLVLILAGVFFYASLPLAIIAVIAFGLGVLTLLNEGAAIPVILLVTIPVMIVVTIVAVLRGVLSRPDKDVAGVRIDFAAYPKLRALLDEVAAAVGTRPIDTAYFVPGPEIGVFERGGLWQLFRGKASERVLLLGVAQFDGMTQLQLRAVLAHEYGYLRNEDTAGGGFALAVRRALASMLERLSASGGGGVFNPAWWFAHIFARIYIAISHGASRLQEVLADRWAVHAYGTEAFVSGYRHVFARTVEAEDHLDKTLKEVIEHRWSLPNLYDHDPEDKKTEDELAAALDKQLQAEPTVHDSHPSPRQRIEWAERLAVRREPGADDGAKVWDLFDDPEPIERAVTASLRDELLKTRGIMISGEDTDDDAGGGDDAAQPAAARATPVTST